MRQNLSKRIIVRLSEDDYAKVDRIARDKGQGISAQVRRYTKEGLERDERKGK